MASWDKALLWCIPMPYKWASVSSFTMQYWWLMEGLSPSNISGLTHWYAGSEWTVAKGPYAVAMQPGMPQGCCGIEAKWLQQGSCHSNAARGACHRVAVALRLNDCSRAAAMALQQRTRVVAAAMHWPKNHTLNWCLTMCQAHYDGVPLLHDSPRSMIIYRIRGPWRWCALFYYGALAMGMNRRAAVPVLHALHQAVELVSCFCWWADGMVCPICFIGL